MGHVAIGVMEVDAPIFFLKSEPDQSPTNHRMSLRVPIIA